MKLRIFLARHPIFTRDEIAGHLAALGQGSPRTTDSLLAYHVRSGRLRRIRRGLYAVQGAGGESTVDPYLVAKLAPDSVLAYHTALELHGNAYSVHHQSLICTRHRVRPLSVDDHRYMALPPPKALRDRRQEDIGVETVAHAWTRRVFRGGLRPPGRLEAGAPSTIEVPPDSEFDLPRGGKGKA